VVGRLDRGDKLKGWRDIAGLYGWLFEFNIPLHIGIYYVSDMMIWRILMEDKRTWGLTHFCGCVVPDNVSRTDKDKSETSSR
jgi:hypothetical protein